MLAHPRVLLASIAAALLMAFAVMTAIPAHAAVTYADPAQKIIDLTNVERSANGLPALTRSTSLDAVAQAWAEELAAIYERALAEDPDAGVPLSHNPYTGKQIPSNWYAWGENVAWNRGYNDPVVKMNDQWINSEHHHDNMVNTRFNYMGAGWYTDKFGVSWGVQVFGHYIGTNPDGAATASAVKAVEKKAPAKDGVDTISLNRGNRYLIKNHLGAGKADKVFWLGKASDVVLLGDWDGDGDDTIAVKRGNRYYVWNSLSAGKPWKTFTIGKASDTPIVGDFNGNGKDTISLKRGNRYLIKNHLGKGAANKVFRMGKASDTPIVGDFNGNGKDTISLKRGNRYFIKNRLGPGASAKVFRMGRSSDVALVGDFNGNGKDTISLKRGNTYYVKYTLGPSASGKTFRIGQGSDTPLVADFDG